MRAALSKCAPLSPYTAPLSPYARRSLHMRAALSICAPLSPYARRSLHLHTASHFYIHTLTHPILSHPTTTTIPCRHHHHPTYQIPCKAPYRFNIVVTNAGSTEQVGTHIPSHFHIHTLPSHHHHFPVLVVLSPSTNMPPPLFFSCPYQ